MTPHNDILPECKEHHEATRFIIYTACSFFLAYLFVFTPIVIAQVNDLRKADETINAGRAKGRLEIEQGVLDLRKETDAKFSEILQRLSSIEAMLKMRTVKI
jgi:hypothetical protein